MLPYDTAASLLHMAIILNNLQVLTYHPTAIFNTDIKAVNALFRKLLHLLPFEPSLYARLQQSLVVDLLQYLRAATSTYF